MSNDGQECPNCGCGEPNNYGITDADFDAACTKAEKALEERAQETSYSSATPIADFYKPMTFSWDPDQARIDRAVKEYLESCPGPGNEGQNGTDDPSN